MRTIEQAVGPYQVTRPGWPLAHAHCIYPESADAGVEQIQADLSQSAFLGRTFQGELMENALKESFWEGATEAQIQLTEG